MKNPVRNLQSPLRILMIAACPFPWPRGTPVRIQRLAEALVQQGHSVDVLTYHLGKTDESLPFQIHRIAKVFYYRRVAAGPSLTKLLVLDPMLVRLLYRTARNHHYDIIHAHHIEGLMTALTASALGLKLPIVYDAHTLAGTELVDYGPQIGSALKRFVGDYLDHALARRADSVIAVTDSIKEAFLNRGTQPENQVHVISNGIEDAFIQRAQKAKLEAGKTGNTQAPLFMFAGNGAAYQGIELMLQAFALVHRQIPDARLRILSDESFIQYEKLMASMNITDSVSVLNVALDELPGQLVQADVLLNPRTRCAGIPQKLLNYMAAGRPVVSFAGSAKILEHRVNGLIVEDGDIRTFADAMLELASNPITGEELSMAALELIKARYSWSSTAKKTLKVYIDTMKQYAG